MENFFNLDKTFSFIEKKDVVQIFQSGNATLTINESEEIFRVKSLGLEWDFGVGIYEPRDPEKQAIGPDGRKIGIFMLHGGSGDYKLMGPVAKAYAALGHKVVSMSLPGRLYLDDESRNWPGDTIKDDHTVRTPIWKTGEHISPDQYDVVIDDTKIARYGRRTLARAKPGTLFYLRMAGWPAAYEVGATEAMKRFLPKEQFSIYGTGHSTGGPHIFMMSQRVPNMVGVLAVEHSPFGAIQARQHAWSGSLGKISGYDRVRTEPDPRSDPFNELYIRSWRDLARYKGPEILGQEGPTALMRLPWIMEDVLDSWENSKRRPNFKAEYIITHNIQHSLRSAARAIADHLGMTNSDAALLEERYTSYPYPLNGQNSRPVPPVLFIITKNSRDHNIDVYRDVVIPSFAEMAPATKVKLIQLGAGVHSYWQPEEELPLGIAPVAAKINHDAIMNGYFNAN